MSDDLTRFMNHVDRIDSVDLCWNWTGAKFREGYGAFGYSHRTWSAHRWIYSMLFGEIPVKYIVHHKCVNRACVNPCHLECISRSSHQVLHHVAGDMNSYQSAKTHCKRGHEFNSINSRLYKKPNGAVYRICRVCDRTKYSRLIQS